MTSRQEPDLSGPPSGFDGLGISPKLLEVLDKAGFVTPTPIQHQAIPVGLQGEDIVGVAQTGTGKTLAFSIPMLQRISRTKGQGLIVLPTRELALQVDEELHKIGKGFGLRTAVLIGGQSMDRQLKQIREKPHVIVVTPGRLIDHLEQRTMNLERVNVLILDEADRMLDMGFAPQIRRILKKVPSDRQTMLFSATIPPEITRIAERFMRMPVRVEVARSGTTSELVEQEMFVVERRDKIRLLKLMVTEEPGTILVFTRTKFGAKKVTRDLVNMGFNAKEIHGNRTLAQRRDALDGFKSGKYRILVATDVASRGIDVTGINLVINFDLPEHADDYVHRIGRTGRADRPGRAISFAMPDQGQLVTDIEILTRNYIPVSRLPELPEYRPPRPPRQSSTGSRGGYGRNRGGYGSGSRGRGGGRRNSPAGNRRRR